MRKTPSKMELAWQEVLEDFWLPQSTLVMNGRKASLTSNYSQCSLRSLFIKTLSPPYCVFHFCAVCSIFPLGCNFSATLISPPQIVNSSLISNQAKTTIMRALWDEKLRNEDCFNETAFVTSWFQKRLRLFISGISPEILQCLHNETMQCEQYQAMYVVGLLIFSFSCDCSVIPGIA